MLQIIGWLGCLYLVVKGFEIAGGPNFRNENGWPSSAAKIAATIAWVGACVFALLLLLQGGALEQPQPMPSEQPEEMLSRRATIDCINKAKGDDDAVMACAGK